MAFAQHDRIIRAGGSAGPAAPSPSSAAASDAAAPQPPESVPEARTAAGLESSPDPSAATGAVESVDRQLSDLDEVLAAIEKATETLERTYADEIGAEQDAPPHGGQPDRATTPGAEARSASSVEDEAAGEGSA